MQLSDTFAASCDNDGESWTTAITKAVRERLESVGRERGVDLISFESGANGFRKAKTRH
jgi:hypothetical protein